MNQKNGKELPIDAVITWVDSNDGAWQNKINAHLENKINWADKKSSTRYNSINEIEIAIASIIKFAPYIRNIFLVTDNQQPKGFSNLKEEANKVGINLELIDHTVLFSGFKDCLPTFNSCSIITMLYRIPNLAEHFIIFNDDTFLMRKTEIKDFFIDGLPVIRGRWDTFYEDKWFRKVYQHYFKKAEQSNFGYKQVQQKSAKFLGFKKYVRRDHTPVSIRKSTLDTYFSKHPDFLKNNVKHKFRNNNQFIISSLSNHLEIKEGTYILQRNFKLSYFQSYKILSTKIKLWLFNCNKNKIFVCFQSLELAEKNIQNYILTWVKNKLEN